ncbi:salivary cystatin-L-like [Pollicipes pollicipes]|uniref:salivary cystatin-L-like n=1 Tax=Pollicipes pollicipes TaxID=41117 RepID=UPI0018853399|nr:salivary cystatin-L-like [Pollicipes pollicipes]
MKIIILALIVQVCRCSGLGSFQEKKVDEATMTMANYAVPLIQSEIDSNKFFTLKSVDKVHHQIVAGKNYKMELTLVETGCDEIAGQQGLACPPLDQPRTVHCKVVVYDVPYRSHREVTKKECGQPA